MSELVCTLRRLLARLPRPSRLPGPDRATSAGPDRTASAGLIAALGWPTSAGWPASVGWPAIAPDRWSCLVLADQSVPADRLRTARELDVRRPAALTPAVLAAAPRLLSVVLPEQARLPAAVRAELDRRRIAIVWRQGGARPVRPRRTSGASALAAAGCPVNRRGSGS